MNRPKKNEKREAWIAYADHLEVELRTSNEDFGAARASLDAAQRKLAELERVGVDEALRQDLERARSKIQVLETGRDQLTRQIHNYRTRKV